MGDRKALFDIGITGPLAGLVPTLVFSFVGLMLSTPVRPACSAPRCSFFPTGQPYLFHWSPSVLGQAARGT